MGAEETSVVFPPVGVTIGAILVCSWFSFLWMGFILVMGYTYFIHYPRDPLWLKSLVVILIAVCITDTVAIGSWSHNWSTTYPDNPAVVALIPIEMEIIVMGLGIISFIVQPFYAWRIWLVSKKMNWWLPILITSLSIAQFAIVTWLVVLFSRHSTFVELAGVIPAAFGWLIPCVLSNICVTVGMVYYLGIHVRRAIPSSRFSLMQIISRTVQANILALVCQVVTVTLMKLDVGFYFLITDVILTKVYTFSVLSSLNTRKTSSANCDSSVQPTRGSLPLTSIGAHFRDSNGKPKSRNGPANILSITIDHEQTEDAKPWEANASSDTQDDLGTREADEEIQKARLSVRVQPETAV